VVVQRFFNARRKVQQAAFEPYRVRMFMHLLMGKPMHLFVWLSAAALSLLTLVPCLVFGIFGIIGWFFIAAFWFFGALLFSLVYSLRPQLDPKEQALPGWRQAERASGKEAKEQEAWDKLIERLRQPSPVGPPSQPAR
jgi:hypothetical protein